MTRWAVSELPKGWADIDIGEVADIVGGGTPKASDPENFSPPGDGISWLTPADLSGYKAKEISHGARDLSEKGYKSCSASLMPPGSILFSSRAPIGYVAVASKEIATNQGFKSFVFDKSIDPSYAYYYLKSIKDLADSRGTGTTFKELSGAAAKALPLRLAPMAEQARIAQALDGLLAQVDTLKARLDGLPALIKRFRQSILAAAVSGKLTEDWRIHQALAATASKSVSDTQVEKWGWEEIPASWETCFYEDAFQSRLGKMLDKAKNTGDETPYLGNINVRWFSFDTSHTQTIRVSDHEAVDLTLTKGDVLICEGGEPGRCAVWNVQNGQYIYQKALHRARAIKSVLPEWLTYNLKNDADNKKLSMLFTGTTIKHLTGRSLATYPIRLPPLIEQNEIVRRVEQLFAFADQLEARLTDARARVDALTQSILAKAFRGELVPQDPADEPASVLLERIKAQRATAPKPKRGRKSV